MLILFAYVTMLTDYVNDLMAQMQWLSDLV